MPEYKFYEKKANKPRITWANIRHGRVTLCEGKYIRLVESYTWPLEPRQCANKNVCIKHVTSLAIKRLTRDCYSCGSF